jgi:sugar/nucleoside kinase (ribokinase family)
LFASDEDLAGDEAELQKWVSGVRVVAVTRSSRGARVFVEGERFEMESYPSEEVDATGAGDVFATAFLVRLHETRDVGEAARFGAAAASLSVEGIGVGAVAAREAILERIRVYPEVGLV